MPRDRRLEIPGGVYHVITRGIERCKIFLDNADCKEFLRRLQETLEKTGCKCYGWVLMSNHFHLVIQTGSRPLSDLMRRLLTGYAVYFNRRYQRSGYLYQNRYKSILCQEDAYLLELIRYVHLNPLRAGIVKDIESLAEYNWSGHSVILGRQIAKWQSVDKVLERFGSKRSLAVKRYLQFVIEGKDKGKQEELMGGGLRRSAGGWEGIRKLRQAKEQWRGDERILGDGNFVNKVLKISEEELIKKEKLKRAGWDLKKLTEYICKMIGVKPEELKKKGKRNKIAEAKGLISYWGRNELNINGRQIGNFLGATRQAINYMAKQGERISREKQYILTF